MARIGARSQVMVEEIRLTLRQRVRPWRAGQTFIG